MKLLDLIHERRKEILEIAAKHGATRVMVFGSAVRGDDTDQSDVDFLVEVTGETTPWFPAGLMRDLKSLLGRPVDIVTTKGLNLHLRPYVLKEAQVL